MCECVRVLALRLLIGWLRRRSSTSARSPEKNPLSFSHILSLKPPIHHPCFSLPACLVFRVAATAPFGKHATIGLLHLGQSIFRRPRRLLPPQKGPFFFSSISHITSSTPKTHPHTFEPNTVISTGLSANRTADTREEKNKRRDRRQRQAPGRRPLPSPAAVTQTRTPDRPCQSWPRLRLHFDLALAIHSLHEHNQFPETKKFEI